MPLGRGPGYKASVTVVFVSQFEFILIGNRKSCLRSGRLDRSSQLGRHLGMSPPRGGIHGDRYHGVGHSVKEMRTESFLPRKGEVTYLRQVSGGAGD